ncbi:MULTISPECIES: mechanosensitive ion channel domain-containing protein [unclassified Pseudoalteromonas]|uniref:mechanosensitive ion channel family protein n=1 Tax=unclassified Pseudoalteromonas TaxID=194690 RepID=UPI000B3D4024|nr:MULTISPECIES: mechanosensitive ion channel domain-containing protein [unclassified Pseudoalteromonas]MDN3378060.1 mechanosensitive ion channel [Pseudoalteromonas sp. APC 3893]MDN3386825.1 mechanosensitive ion channel [Pseudoalteromonas sp. APC 4017]OUS74535.1 mechanosensitive ion channel protein [Pseudoalteromonas sp. A601]
MDEISIEVIYTQAIEMLMLYGPKFLLAIFVLIIGWWFIGRISNMAEKSMARVKFEAGLTHFLVSFISVILKVLLLISVASMIGIETTSFIAMLGAAGLAVGMALQGSLANFAGGVLILFFKPFKVGDVIEAQGHMGKVVEIQIFVTVLLTYDNEKIIIPNGALSNGCVKNKFAEPTRRIDIEFGISYGDDIIRAREVLMSVLNDYDLVLKEENKQPVVHVSQHGDSHIGMLVWAWVDSDNFWPVYFGLYERVKIAFDKENITIPFPQRDVHIHQFPGK